MIDGLHWPRRDPGCELLAAGGSLIFGTAFISLEFQPLIIMPSVPRVDVLDGVYVFPWTLLLFVLGSVLTMTGALTSHLSPSIRIRLTRVLSGLGGAVVLAHSIYALIVTIGVTEAPRWMMRSNMFYGPNAIPFVQVYTGFFILALGLGLAVAVVGLHSLKHQFQ